MFKRACVFFLGLLAAGLILPEASWSSTAFLQAEPASEVNPDGPYFKGPIYFGFSDFSANASTIEDKLVSAILGEAVIARAAGLTRDNKDWPAAAVYVAAYSFTSKKLADALIYAAKSGCEVTVVMDKKQSQGKGSLASFLALNGIVVYLDASHNAMHSKYILCRVPCRLRAGKTNAAFWASCRRLRKLRGDVRQLPAPDLSFVPSSRF